jgi:hypothetical protein
VTDAREAFIAGASWWAEKEGLGFSPEATALEAEHYFPEGRIDHPDGVYGPGRKPGPQGDWPVTYIGRAFVDGAKWQQYTVGGNTMWQSDQREAEQEAAGRYPMEDSKP